MLQYLISVSVLIVAVLVVRTIFRQHISPRWTYALWLVVLIRLCIPVSLFEVRLPQIILENTSYLQESSLLPKETAEPMDNAPLLPNEVTVIPAKPADPQFTPSDSIIPSVTDPENMGQHTPVSPSETVTKPTVSENDSVPPQMVIPQTRDTVPLKKVLMTVWLIGSLIMTIWFFVTGMIFYSRLHRDRLFYKQIHRTKVYISESKGAPCLAGLLPSIYITPQAADSRAQSLIMIHEYTHLRHGDHVWAFLRILVLIVLWWNPLVWVAALTSQVDCELACDDAIAAKLDDDQRFAYAHILLDTVPQKTPYAVGLGSAPIKERILKLTKKSKNRTVCVCLALLLIFSAVGCAFVDVNADPDENLKETDGSDAADLVKQDKLGEQYSALTDLLSMTVGEIRQSYGELSRQYSEYGPGQPVYSIAGHEGILLVFHSWDYDRMIEDTMYPSEIILNSVYTGEVRSISVCGRLEEMSDVLCWDDAWWDLDMGCVWLGHAFDDYVLHVVLNDSDIPRPSEDTATEDEWASWSENYRKEPSGTVVQIRISPKQQKDSQNGASLIGIKENAGGFTVREVQIPLPDNGQYRLWPYDERYTLCLAYVVTGDGPDDASYTYDEHHLYLIDTEVGEIAADCRIDSDAYLSSIHYIEDACYLFGYGYEKEIDPFMVKYEDGQLVVTETAGVFPFDSVVADMPIVSPSGTYTVYTTWDDASGHGTMSVRYTDGTTAILKTHLHPGDRMDNGSLASLADSARYSPVGFADDTHLIYRITGWEYTKGWGIYDLSTGEDIRYPLGLDPVGVRGDVLYLAEAQSYITKAYLTSNLDGTDQRVLASTTQEEGVPYVNGEYGLADFSDGKWLVFRFEDQEDVLLKDATVTAEVISDDFQSSLLTLVFPYHSFYRDAVALRGNTCTVILPIQRAVSDSKDSDKEENKAYWNHGPFLGYVASAETPWIDLYTETTKAYVGRIPYDIFHDWVATDRDVETWEPGFMEPYVAFYYAEFGDFRWAAAHLTGTVLGSGRKNIATSSDGGLTWNIGSVSDDYGGNHVLGMGFASEDVAFISYDPMYEHDKDYRGPIISRTVNGGKTWEIMSLEIPHGLQKYALVSRTPTFYGNIGTIPVTLCIGNTGVTEVLLITTDGGMTWEWDLENYYALSADYTQTPLDALTWEKVEEEPCVARHLSHDDVTEIYDMYGDRSVALIRASDGTNYAALCTDDGYLAFHKIESTFTTSFRIAEAANIFGNSGICVSYSVGANAKNICYFTFEGGTPRFVLCCNKNTFCEDGMIYETYGSMGQQVNVYREVDGNVYRCDLNEVLASLLPDESSLFLYTTWASGGTQVISISHSTSGGNSICWFEDDTFHHVKNGIFVS